MAVGGSATSGTSAAYIGIGGTAKKIKNIYIGVGGTAKKVKKAYIGVGGVAKLWYSFARTWVWEKYTVTSTSEYEMYSGSNSSTRAYTRFYVGSTYSFNSITGEFTVNQNTQITINSSGASTAKYKYYITLSSSSGSRTGSTLYYIRSASYDQQTGTGFTVSYTPYYSRLVESGPEKGTYIEDVTSENFSDYPVNGPQDGYWYVLKMDYDYTLSYTGNYVDTVAEMEGTYYRLLEFTSSGTLTLGKAVNADVWICGGGAGGGSAGYGYGNYYGGGGCGGYAASWHKDGLSSLTITIGAGGATDAQGGTSSISGNLSGSASGGTSAAYSTGGTGGSGGGASWCPNGTGDGLDKKPFGSTYFYPYCDGGGGSAVEDEPTYYQGGAGGTNGGNGGSIIEDTGTSNTIPGGVGGGHYGGNGGSMNAGNYVYSNGSSATGYGSGGGGSTNQNGGGSGYQGVCFIRIPL